MTNIWNLFWLFIVFVSLMPMVQQKIMQAKRLGLMRALEKKRNSRVITLIHHTPPGDDEISRLPTNEVYRHK